ncbi:hypothetical protein QUF72_16870 [Desulfobacterales bacterium HSG2]|nr:hypothetical protein [Desulfobacterales bacterium HSG2]
MKKRFFIILTILSCFLPCSFTDSKGYADDECVIKMGYRTNKREPLKGERPDNSGLYYDLYTKAAKRIGCKLEVIRKPKRRILNDLKERSMPALAHIRYLESRITTLPRSVSDRISRPIPCFILISAS